MLAGLLHHLRGPQDGLRREAQRHGPRQASVHAGVGERLYEHVDVGGPGAREAGHRVQQVLGDAMGDAHGREHAVDELQLPLEAALAPRVRGGGLADQAGSVGHHADHLGLLSDGAAAGEALDVGVDGDASAYGDENLVRLPERPNVLEYRANPLGLDRDDHDIRPLDELAGARGGAKSLPDRRLHHLRHDVGRHDVLRARQVLPQDAQRHRLRHGAPADEAQLEVVQLLGQRRRCPLATLGVGLGHVDALLARGMHASPIKERGVRRGRPPSGGEVRGAARPWAPGAVPQRGQAGKHPSC
mmetsp:Transcript_59605/g.156719  ORF Transcript_59605/g.156719 Transcript_59605/m.156719 type:complete len:301 (-) Transcript_59605:22-924(-)